MWMRESQLMVLAGHRMYRMKRAVLHSRWGGPAGQIDGELEEHTASIRPSGQIASL